MSTFGHVYGDTLAALQAKQLAQEAQLKMNARISAAKVVTFHSKKKKWPEGDLDEVLGALGLPREPS